MEEFHIKIDLLKPLQDNDLWCEFFPISSVSSKSIESIHEHETTPTIKSEDLISQEVLEMND